MILIITITKQTIVRKKGNIYILSERDKKYIYCMEIRDWATIISYENIIVTNLKGKFFVVLNLSLII